MSQPASEGACANGEVAIALVCIDRCEAPGCGALPVRVASAQAAEEACRSRGARLCSANEWESGCRGQNRASYPYGNTWAREMCNVRSGEVLPAGSLTTCASAHGVLDMAGNVAEWVAEGAIRGGSALSDEDGRCSRSRNESRTDDVGYRCCRDRLVKDSHD